MAAFKVLAAEGSFVQYSRQEKMSGARASEKCRLRRRSSFVHAGDCNVLLCIVRGQRDDENRNRELHRNMERLYRKAYDLGGLTSGEHGVGLAKQPYFLANTPDINLAVMRSVKDALDNRHILNDHISYLK